MQDVKEALVNERERLFVELKGISFLEPYPSHANFILCSVTGDKSAKQLKVPKAVGSSTLSDAFKKEFFNSYFKSGSIFFSIYISQGIVLEPSMCNSLVYSCADGSCKRGCDGTPL